MTKLLKYFLPYFQEVQRYLNQIEAELTQPNATQNKILKDVHSMKGMAKALHFKDQVAILFQMESAGENTDWDSFKNQLKDFKTEFFNWASAQNFSAINAHHKLSDCLEALKAQQTHFSISILCTHDVDISGHHFNALFNWLMTLFQNSLAHGFSDFKKNQTEPTIILKGHENSTHLTIEFEDNGAGINLAALLPKTPQKFQAQFKKLTQKDASKLNPEELELILDTICHSQLSTAQHKTIEAGRGLGLASIKSEIESNHGHLILKKTSPTGTVFELKVPTSTTRSH